MVDKPTSPQQLIDDDDTKVFDETHSSDVQNTDYSTTITPLTPSEPAMRPIASTSNMVQTNVSTPTPELMIIPTKEKEKDEQKTNQPPKPKKKKDRKGILIATLLFFILTLPIVIYYVTQSSQLAEIRSRANLVYPSITPPTDLKSCTTSARGGKCGPGGPYYLSDWLPNHVICGTCDRADNFNTCGTWEGEAAINKAECCGQTCGGDFPWTFENQCLSTHTSNREACFHVEADCNRVQPCREPTSTIGPTSPPGPTEPPGPTNTPNPTSTPTNTPNPTSTPTDEPTATPTTGPTNTPAPGTCDASCDTDSNCESGLSCVTSTGVKRCRNVSCPDESDCLCLNATATPTTTYYANNTPIPTRISLITNNTSTTPTDQPTPKIPVAGVGPGFIGIISVVGSIFLLLIGLAL